MLATLGVLLGVVLRDSAWPSLSNDLPHLPHLPNPDKSCGTASVLCIDIGLHFSLALCSVEWGRTIIGFPL